MGGKPPKIPKPAPPPKIATPTDPAVVAADKNFRARNAAAMNRQSTLLTGGLGAEANSSQTTRKSLLGQ